jgi:predicted  nucleic acid-binding Zn-ribbon protein
MDNLTDQNERKALGKEIRQLQQRIDSLQANT